MKKMTVNNSKDRYDYDESLINGSMNLQEK
jgi:hypothetical protein